MPEIKITVGDAASVRERATIIGGLVAYNDAHHATQRYQELAAVARVGDDIVGGLLGYTHMDWLFIAQLWLAEEYRGTGTGRRLVHSAESEALKRGCSHAHCDTFDFQALPFYQKLGYEIFGQLDDYPPGHSRFFLQKRDLKRRLRHAM